MCLSHASGVSIAARALERPIPATIAAVLAWQATAPGRWNWSVNPSYRCRRSTTPCPQQRSALRVHSQS